ncbi:MAG: hypothetical protein ACJAT1_000146 [Marivirga sp.]|jgi:hypothetical protein
MKKLYNYLQAAMLISLLGACTVQSSDEGPIGPQGPRGAPGAQGVPGEEAYVFEYDGITFAAGNDFTQFLEFPADFSMFETDHVLIYFLWDYLPDEDVDVWRILPQTLFTVDGTLVYNYDNTRTDVKLFMDANFNLDVLAADYTDDWVVRAVVVPGGYGRAATTGLDFNDYDAVIDYYNLDDSGKYDKQRRPR